MINKFNKISIIGTGHVGETAAMLLALKGLCVEMVLVDIREDAAAGSALDLNHALSLFHQDMLILGTEDIQAVVNSDLIIFTAGIPRKPGMSRFDVLETNVKLVESQMKIIKEIAPDTMILMVSNPVDVLTHVAWKITEFEAHRVFGMAGVLDSARMAFNTVNEHNDFHDLLDIKPTVLGGHGDTMVPAMSFTTELSSSSSIRTQLTPEQENVIISKTQTAGADVLALRKTGSAYIAPAAAVVKMVEEIAQSSGAMLPCVTPITADLSIGTVCLLHRKGVFANDSFMLSALTEEEAEAFEKSKAQTQRDIKEGIELLS